MDLWHANGPSEARRMRIVFNTGRATTEAHKAKEVRMYTAQVFTILVFTNILVWILFSVI